MVAYPAGRGSVLLLQLAPYGSGQVKALQGDILRAIEPSSNGVLAEFTAGSGPFFVVDNSNGAYPAAAPSYGYPPPPTGMPGGWGPPPPQNYGWAPPVAPAAAFAQVPRAPAPNTPAPAPAAAAAAAATDDDGSAGSTLKTRIQGMMQRLRSQSRALSNLVESETLQLKETLRTIAVAASAAAKQPKKKKKEGKKNGNDLTSKVADIPGQATFEARWRAFLDGVRGRLKSMKLLSKEMSVNMVMGQMSPEDHKSMSAELALMMDGIREALQLVDQCRISATVAAPPAAPAGCCGAAEEEEEPRELAYALTDDISIQAYLSDIRQNFNVKDLNLGNMKIALGSDLGGTYTVGGQTNFSYDTSAENHINRATKTPTAKTPLMADADDDPYGNADVYDGGDPYAGGGIQAGIRPPDYDQKVNS